MKDIFVYYLDHVKINLGTILKCMVNASQKHLLFCKKLWEHHRNELSLGNLDLRFFNVLTPLILAIRKSTRSNQGITRKEAESINKFSEKKKCLPQVLSLYTQFSGS